MLQDLRSMLHRQQFEALARADKCYLGEGGDAQVVSLPFLACPHSGDSAKVPERPAGHAFLH